MINDIEDFFTKGCGRCARFATPHCSTRRWERGLLELRRICLGCGLAETVKWGHPCYMHAGRNIAIIGAYRADFRISFFEAALMQDAAGVLVRQGPNTRHADAIRFTHPAQVAEIAPILRSYLKEAMGYAEAGLKAPKEAPDIEPLDELRAALDADPELAAAFHALTPGRQRSYMINLRSAKKPATRAARIARFRARILAGKGAQEWFAE